MEKLVLSWVGSTARTRAGALGRRRVEGRVVQSDEMTAEWRDYHSVVHLVDTMGNCLADPSVVPWADNWADSWDEQLAGGTAGSLAAELAGVTAATRAEHWVVC